MTAANSAAAAEPPRPRLVIPYLVLAVALLVTFAAAAYVHLTAAASDRARFDHHVERTQTAIQRRIETYVNLLRAGAGLFAAQEFVTREEFKAFVDRLDLPGRYPGIQGMGIAARATPQTKEPLVQRLRNGGAPDFAIRPEHERDDYFPIIYLEPMDRRNQAAIGYDMFTEPTRRAAMEQARDTGSAATSGRVILVQEIDQSHVQAGFLIYVPIYYVRGIPSTVEERRSLIAGFSYAPFRADDLLTGILGTERSPTGIHLSVYDGNSTDESALLHRSDRQAPQETARSRFARMVTVDVPGRQWTVVYRSSPAFDAASAGRGFTFLVLAAGGITSVLLFALTAAQTAAAQRAEHAADQLRRSESRFRRLVDSNLIGVVFSTLDGQVRDGNGEYFRIVGRTRDQVLAGKVRWDEMTPPEYQEADERAVRELRATGVCAPFEKEFLRPDGTRVPVLVGVALLEGSERETVALYVDLTERKSAEREILRAKDAADAARAAAEEASRLKDEFLATVSHELRTPLNAILGWAQLLRAGGQTAPSDLEHGLETIERSAKAQAQLIDDLLDVSRIVAGKMRLDVRAVQLAPVIEAAIASVQPAADAKGVRIVKVLDPETGPVNGDPARLQQIVWNLLSNAVKFTPRDGVVQVTLRREDGQAKIVVSDTGIGIPPQFMPHVFDRFRQADAATTRRFGGLGLGLGIVRHLTELHGGSVAAESAGENEGSTFIVSLPLARAEVQQAEPRSRPLNGESLEGVRVLLVEDDPDTRELLTRVLRDRGATVSPAASAADAIAVFAALRPDVLVSDIGMPEEDGYSLMARIRTLAADRGGTIPAVALTALARPEDRRRAMQAGFQVHVAKPVEPADLVRVIAGLVRAPRADDNGVPLHEG